MRYPHHGHGSPDDYYYDHDGNSQWYYHREYFINRYGGDRSRYNGRYEGDRRSRSPRDRSPYGDRVDRGPQYSDGDRRRPPIDNRGNSTGFTPGRDGFRDSLSGIQPPRGPKALLDASSGPRGGGFAGGDYRGGRGAGRGGGRGGRPQWRDESRDGGRERDDYRAWEDRSRERERDQRDLIRDHPRDREWPPRDSIRDRDFPPRGRRTPPPPGPPRGRSPPSLRDFRDPRDGPLGVDADRARRGSRDGPLSAGSSNSDPSFGLAPFRQGEFRGGGSFRGGGGRGMGRGRGDWDQQHARGLGRGRGFYDDRGPDSYQNQRSRSQEGGRWPRDQDDRDRREPRYPETAREPPRDDRDIRAERERDLIRPPKLDRVSHEPPSAKDVSPPPVAPSAPPFASRAADIPSLTGKPVPTGPRALDRPGSAGHAGSNDRPPPTGPSKSITTENNPTIPSGPRAQQNQKHPPRSSKTWVNPKLQEGPKSARSQSFQSQLQRPFGGFRPESSQSDYHDYDKRARSPDAKSDSHTHSADRYGGFHGTGPNEIVIKAERGSHSARASLDREMRAPLDRHTRAATDDGDVVMGGTSDISPVERVTKEAERLRNRQPSQAVETEVPAISAAKATVAQAAEPSGEKGVGGKPEAQPERADTSGPAVDLPKPDSDKAREASEPPTRQKDSQGDDKMLDYEKPEESRKQPELATEHKDTGRENPNEHVNREEKGNPAEDSNKDESMGDYGGVEGGEIRRKAPSEKGESGRLPPLDLPAVEHGPIRRPTPVVMPAEESSSDDEDIDEYFKEEITKIEEEVKDMEDVVSDTPREVVARYAKVVHGALASVLVDSVTVSDLVNGVIRDPTKPDGNIPSKVATGDKEAAAAGGPSLDAEEEGVKVKIDAAPEPEADQELRPEAAAEIRPEPKVNVEPELASEAQPGQLAQSDIRSLESDRTPQASSHPEAAVETEKRPASHPPQPPREPTHEPTIEQVHELAAPEPTREPSALPTVEKADDVEGPSHAKELQPKLEDVDAEGPGLPSVPAVHEVMQVDHDADMQDVEMQDALEVHETVEPSHRSLSVSGRRSTSVNGDSASANGRSVSANGVSAEGVISGLFAPNPFLPPLSARSTPSQMEDEESEDRTEDDDRSIYRSVEDVREFSATPPTEDLPQYNVKPWFESGRAFEFAENPPSFGDFVLNHMSEEWSETKAKQDTAREEYRKGYDAYLRFTTSNDPVAIKSRTHFASDGTTGKDGRSSHYDSKPEGSRRTTGRFATELDLKNALEQSKREHQERQEREARALKEKYRTEKEAVIPDMLWTDSEKEQSSFYDTAGLLPIEKLVATWNVVPWHVNFTPEEAECFERLYLEHPKQWGKIAQDMPNRDIGTIIQYYYSKKRELNLKDKLKKQPKKRKRGGRKQRSSALVSELGNGENETEEGAQDTSENGERRGRPPRRAAAPNFGGNEAAANADSDGATPSATPGRRRAATAVDAKNDSGAEKQEAKKSGRRKTKGEKDMGKAPKPVAQTPVPSPLAVPGKPGRSRANSRAQGSEWLSPQTPIDLAARAPVQYEMPPGSMQPPHVPHQQPHPHPHHTSPERPLPPPLQSTIADVMAPPPPSLSLRPDPPQPPASSLTTFEVPQQGGPERNRTPQQQASSYWSVAESQDFPQLLRSFGTDWSAIAGHMQTKTPTMVKNFYIRNTKDGTKPEWEGIAAEADEKGRRGEKRPDPPPLSIGPRKKYDVPSVHRTLAAAEPEEAPLAKIEPGPPAQHFSRFQLPLAQAAPVVSHAHAQPSQTVVSTPLAPSTQAQQQPLPSGPAVTQAMSPHNHPLRPPVPPGYQYQEREPEPSSSQSSMTPSSQQHIRISQKPPPPPPSASAPHTPVAEVPPRTSGFDHFSLHPQQKESRDARDARDRQRLDLAQREPPRPVRMKQEPSDHPEPYPPYQPPRSAVPPRSEPLALARQPETLRVAPAPQSYAPPPPPPPPAQPQPVRSVLSESVPQGTTPIMSANDRSMSILQRPPPVSMQEPYGVMPISTAAPPPPPQTPTPSRAPEPRKTSNIMSLLNDDPPPAPKRVVEVATTVKPSSTPPPQAMGVRQPAQPSAPPSSRREVEAGYPYSHSAPQAPPTAIPPLKPYHTRSPQSGHMRSTSTASIGQTLDSGMEGQQPRDYYSRHPYAPHQTSATNSPQTHSVHHYPPQAAQHQHAAQQHPTQRTPQHSHQHSQSHSQQGSISYQQQQPPPQQYPYAVTQAHAASPTPQYAPHPAMQSRREPPAAQPSPREPWPPTQQQAVSQQQLHHQQQVQQQQQQQQQLHQQHHAQQQQQQQQQHHQQAQQQQSAWPPSQQAPPPKASQPPVQSAWGAQHGVQAKTPVSSSIASQQQHAWPASGPSQSSQPFNLRESRAPPPYPHESQSPTAGMVHHQQHGSLGGGRFPPAAQDSRRGEPIPPAQSQPYGRYGTNPAAGQGRDPVRSYTPANAYDPRPPPPQAYAHQEAMRDHHQLREAQLRENHLRESQMRESQMRESQMRESQMREAQMREMAVRDMRDPRDMGRDHREMVRGDPRDPRDPRDAAAAAAAAAAHQQAQQQAMLGRQLRPQQDPYDRGGPPDQRRY